MRLSLAKSLTMITLALSLTACSKPQSANDYVVGPDLENLNGPFGAGQMVILSEPTVINAVKSVSEAINPKDEQPRMRIEIRRDGPIPVATLTNVLSGTKPYLSGVSWHSFTPIIAETNKEARQYWIGGFNLSRTPDRSIYMLLRYPKDLRFTLGSKTDKAEYMLLDCYDLRVGRMPVESFAPQAPKAEKPREFKPESLPEAGDCEFNSLKEAYGLTPQILNHYDRIKHYEDAPTPDWLPVTIEVK